MEHTREISKRLDIEAVCESLPAQQACSAQDNEDDDAILVKSTCRFQLLIFENLCGGKFVIRQLLNFRNLPFA